MEIQFLADCPEVIPAIACLHQLEMKLGVESNYQGSIDKFQQRCNRDSLPLSLVAFVDTLLIGSASLVECDLPSHLHLQPWLASLFVATSYQRRGIGCQLMQQIESIAKNIGYQQLYLYTWTAEKYYYQLGWRAIDTVQSEGRPHSIVMQKKLCNS